MRQSENVDIVSVKLFGKAINIIDKKVSNNEVTYKFDSEFSFLSKERTLAFRHSIEIIKRDDSSVLALFDIGCAFRIGGAKSETPLMEISSELFLKINEVAISTIRGILFVELSTSSISHLVLPVIPEEWFEKFFSLNPGQMVKPTNLTS